MDTHRTDTDHTGAVDRQLALLEVPGPTGIPIGRRLLLVEGDGQRAVFHGTAALHVYDIGDGDAERACIAMLSRAGLAFDVEIAAAFGCHRNTVGRLARQLADDGLAGVVAAKRGPKGRHKVTGQVQAVIDEHAGVLGPAALARLVAETTGVELSREHVRRLSQAARPANPEPVQDALDTTDPEPCGEVAEDDETAVPAGGQHEPDEGDQGDGQAADEGGATGLAEVEGEGGFDPPVTLPDDVSGGYVGLALFYPAVAALGLVEIARQVFALPRSVRFGVRAVALTLLFLTLLGRPTVESAKHLRRASFGAVAGCGRAPSVKTLRRKLDELAGQGQAAEFGTAMARRFIDRGIVDTAYLYIDGHMQAYNGKRRLEKVWSTKRRMPLPGINTYHVGDITGRPLLFVTQPLSTNLAKAMPDIIATIRQAVGADATFTVVFDRGGYDGSLFSWLDSQGIGFITYHKGDPDLPVGMFARRETRFEGRRVRFQIAEDTVTIAGSGPWQRVVVCTTDG
jgi:transposase